MTSRMKNILRGAGQVLDVFPNSRPIPAGGPATDRQSLGGDWRRVGDDLRKGMEHERNQQQRAR